MSYSDFSLKALRDELINDPLGKGYAGQSDADAAANLDCTILLVCLRVYNHNLGLILLLFL